MPSERAMSALGSKPLMLALSIPAVAYAVAAFGESAIGSV